jgi:UPF0271 protein
MQPAVIDLNADVGEAEDGSDLALVPLVTTVHIACGFHAGGPELMRRALDAAAAAGVVVGAHPGYPDRAGFGRRETGRPPARIAEDVAYQLGALAALARAAGTSVGSVKAHGALYHRMATDPACAAAVAGAVAGAGVARLVVAATLSDTGPVARVLAETPAGAAVALDREGFCDRAYRPDGRLADRGTPGAVLRDPAAAARQALALARDHSVVTEDGSLLALAPSTLCVHGDTPDAVAVARAVRAALHGAGIEVAAPGPTGR